MFKLKIQHQVFDIRKIVDSGQIFNYIKLSDSQYIFIYQKYYTIIEQIDEGYLFHCSENEFRAIWSAYFDLERDYESALVKIIEADSRMSVIVGSFQGVRILRQDSFEMLITFIVSQSKSIPQIRKLICHLSENFGNKLGEIYAENAGEKIDIYQFPSAEQLKHLTESDFRNMKFGYRAPYLVDAIRHEIETGLGNIRDLENKELLMTLKNIKGVGNKVAACVMLFGFGRMDVFPVDTWMRKMMIELYYNELINSYTSAESKSKRNATKEITISNDTIETFGLKKFGEYSGLAQQFLFEYSRQGQKSFKK